MCVKVVTPLRTVLVRTNSIIKEVFVFCTGLEIAVTNVILRDIPAMREIRSYNLVHIM